MAQKERVRDHHVAVELGALGEDAHSTLILHFVIEVMSPALSIVLVATAQRKSFCFTRLVIKLTEANLTGVVVFACTRVVYIWMLLR